MLFLCWFITLIIQCFLALSISACDLLVRNISHSRHRLPSFYVLSPELPFRSLDRLSSDHFVVIVFSSFHSVFWFCVENEIGPGVDGLKRLQLAPKLFDWFVDASRCFQRRRRRDSFSTMIVTRLITAWLISLKHDANSYLTIAVCRGKRSYLLTMLIIRIMQDELLQFIVSTSL